MQRERVLMDRWTSLYSRFNEVLAGIRVVKAFNMEAAEQQRFLSGQRAGNEIVRRGVRTDSRTEALRGLAAAAARLAALGYGSYVATRGEITVGTLVAFLGYTGALFAPVQRLTTVYQTLRRGTVSMEIIFGILDAEDDLADAKDAVELPTVGGDVRFHDVDFGYREGAPVLSGLSLHVRAGETIAVVGPSGSGKTTIALLLQRFHRVTDGSITVDDIDVGELTTQSLRRHDLARSHDLHHCPPAFNRGRSGPHRRPAGRRD